MGKLIAIIFGVIFVVLVGLSFSGITTVQEGFRGVKKTFGKVETEALTPGLYFYNPFTTDIEPFDIRTQKFEETITTYTKDVQEASIAYVINYSVKPDFVVPLYSTVGKDYASKVIPQAITGAIKDVIGHWDAVELINKRDVAREGIETKIESTLENRGLTVERIELSDISYRDEFEHAVENKVIAIQAAEESKNKTVRIQEEARQKVIAAEAEAESVRILGEALAQNKDLVSLKAVEKWSGEVPSSLVITSDNGSMPVILPFLNKTDH